MVKKRVSEKKADIDKAASKLADEMADREYGKMKDDEKLKRLGVDMPESMYESFFIKARTNKTDMSTLVRQWIVKYTNNH